MITAPLSEFHSLDITRPAELRHLIEQLGGLLDIEPERPATYQRQLDEIVALSVQQPTEGGSRPAATSAEPSLSTELQRVLALFAAREDRGINNALTSDVARELTLPMSEAQHRIDLLLAAEMLDCSYFSDGYVLKA